ncbi:hypothetical protein HML84_06755 [Alcanivorax sp. IO_7]|nr:hypothetical protein HML84_06755 [Alcanivorax sp. IO_7]
MVPPAEAGHEPGLPLTFQGGDLTLDGEWRWADVPHLAGRLSGRDVDLDWGSVQARDLDAELALNWDDGAAHLATVTPLTLASLDVGVPITDLRLDLDSDLSTWTVRRAHARVLGGEIRTPVDLAVAGLAAGGDHADRTVATGRPAGRTGGGPVRPGGRLHPAATAEGQHRRAPGAARQRNAVVPGDSAVQRRPGHGAIQPRRVPRPGRPQPAAHPAIPGRRGHGRGRLAGRRRAHPGHQPAKNALPVVFNYTHKENVLELLRSLRIGDRITDQVMTESKR